MSRSFVDYRRPEHRRAVFHDFYEFHLKYRSHPGCVYYLIPYLRDRLGWDREQTLWFAFLNGNTQNPITSLILHEAAPTLDHADKAVEFYKQNYQRLSFDTDRRFAKKAFALSVSSFLELLDGATQEDFWDNRARLGFNAMWRAANRIKTFGRMSAFSFLEYLRVCGVDFDCETMFLEDISGSRSHRNGLCIVLGLDQYDWHESNPSFNGDYGDDLIQRLGAEGAKLLDEARARAKGLPWERDVSYFTLESTLCTYKGWHRVDRRYPNVYNDILFNRIKDAERAWSDRSFSLFWSARADSLPPHLLLENNAADVGLHPIKQNHYRLTGQPVMMDVDYPQYANDYNRCVRRIQAK